MNELVLSLGLVFLIMFLLMLLGVPLGWSMMLGGLAGFASTGMLSRGLYMASYTAWSQSTSESLICIPLYLLMGQFLFLSGMTSKLFELAMSLLGWLKLRAGLAMAVVVANAFFGAVSGSIAAAISAFGPVVMPEADKYRYDKNFIGASLAAAGSLASLIPPSLGQILYGVLTETSIAKLFIAGLIPGILLTLLNSATIYAMARRNPALAPTSATVLSAMRWRETARLTLNNSPVASVILVVLGGIYVGWFTPTESAGIGAGMVLILALLMRKLTMEHFMASFLGAGRTYGMILVLLIGAYLVTGFISFSQTIPLVAKFMIGLGLNRYTFLLAIWILYLIMGCFISGYGIIVLAIPLFFPIAVDLGIDPIWFGIFTNLGVEVSALTPPIGINVFTMQGVANDPEVTTAGMFRLVWPFIVAVHILGIFMFLFPQICLWLPSTMN
jgi:C4-dicarboxylate transporter DctM subunit